MSENLNHLRKNQLEAINISKENDFQSGIHYHATGTGKSWIAMYILKEFNIKYPKKNILWICERKDILKQQFNKPILKERGFDSILKKFNVLDFVENKSEDWYNSLNVSSFWGKPFLCIINRPFLTTKRKYKLIKPLISLVIHDECHSIENKTTQDFYQWLTPKSRIIGFSATPEYIKPLDNILSKYSIYDGFLEKVILPPKIIWIKSENKFILEHLIDILKRYIDNLPYKKIIVWCGIIEECIKIANQWKPYFMDFDFCIDFNNIEKYQDNKLKDFNYFYKSKSKSILFCAVKHREGSDIPNIDGCIFMDLVSQRSERVFIQCMGRVLRKDKENKKKYGLVIDLRAKSTIEICNRVQHYLKLEDKFPWSYNLSKIKIDKIKYFVNELNMIKVLSKSININSLLDKGYSKEEIVKYFKREIPNEEKYLKRLDYEIKLIQSKKLFGNMVQALQILDLTKNIPHVTRGSCGSSLVCYLLGISHVDPVKYNISFARFLNKYRENLPDIDFDFPHYLRDEVFLKLFQKWGNKVARISNHNYYHEKSALREALRINGIRKIISKYDLQKEINSLDEELQRKIFKTQRELEGKFRGFSLHCGGIIYFPNGIPSDNILERQKDSIITQVTLNKVDVSKNNNFKIDILSSRALSQLYYCNSFNKIDFDKHIGDIETIDLLCRGENIGLTLAETPIMRKALLLIQPKTINELAICISIIRPAASEAKNDFETGKSGNYLVFDDDVLNIISNLVGCDEEVADKLRRGYCKGKSECIELLQTFLDKKPILIRRKIKNILKNLNKYSFCKAHAISYAQLIWQLAFQKVHKPKRFWKATLKNVNSSYRNWVHLYEAKCNGINPKQRQKSIYAERKNKNFIEMKSPLEQLQKYGYWNMKDDSFFPDCYGVIHNEYYHFMGVIASSRILRYGKKRNLILFVGIGKQEYIEITVKGKFKFDSQIVIIKGKGIKKNNIYQTVECLGKNITFY